MEEARALRNPWTRRRKRGLRALPLRLLALVSLGLVIAAGLGLVRQARERRPTVPKIAALARALPTAAAPRPEPDAPGVLSVSLDGIAFPDWQRFGWRPVGVRRDAIASRDAVTVTYAHGGRRLTYTIVSGTGHIDYATALDSHYLEAPRGPKVELNFLGDGRTLAFKRRERTIVITSQAVASVPPATMMRLANFRAGGRLAF